MVTNRNADGQFPKKFYHGKFELYDKLGFNEEQTKILVDEWNALIGEGWSESMFLQKADMLFTKHQLLLLFTLARHQKR